MKSFTIGLGASFITFLLYFIIFGTTEDVDVFKMIYGFGYFSITPFYALVFLETGKVLLFLAAIVVFGLLFRRIGTCMRPSLAWVAYALLILHWLVFGIYSAGFII